MSNTNPQHDEVIRDIINEHHGSINIDMVPGTLYSLISDELDTRGYDDTGFDDHPFIQHLNMAPEKRSFSSYHDIYHFSKSFIPEIQEPTRLPIPTCDEKKKLFDLIDNGGLDEDKKYELLERINEIDKDLYEIMIEQKANNKVHENHDGFVYITNDDIKKFRSEKRKNSNHDSAPSKSSPDSTPTSNTQTFSDDSALTPPSDQEKPNGSSPVSDSSRKSSSSESQDDIYGDKVKQAQEKAMARDKSASYKQALENPLTTGIMGVLGALGNYAAMGLVRTSDTLSSAVQGQVSKHEKIAKKQKFLNNMVAINNTHIGDIVAENNQIMDFISSRSESDTLDKAFLERSRTALNRMSDNVAELCEKKAKKRIPESSHEKVEEHLNAVDQFINEFSTTPLGEKMKDISEALAQLIEDISNMVKSFGRKDNDSVERSP